MRNMSSWRLLVNKPNRMYWEYFWARRILAAKLNMEKIGNRWDIRLINVEGFELESGYANTKTQAMNTVKKFKENYKIGYGGQYTVR